MDRRQRKLFPKQSHTVLQDIREGSDQTDTPPRRLRGCYLPMGISTLRIQTVETSPTNAWLTKLIVLMSWGPEVLKETESPLQRARVQFFFPETQRNNSSLKSAETVCDEVCVCSVAQLCLILLGLQGQQTTWLLCLWNSPGKNTGMGCHFLLQRIFPTQGSNLHLLCLLHCRQILDPVSHW